MKLINTNREQENKTMASFLVVVKHIRPNTDVAFWEKSPEHQAVVDGYKDSGIIENFEELFSDDTLIRTQKTRFPNEAAYNAFKEDPGIVAGSAETAKYNSKNGIRVARYNKIINPPS